jgi:hypothetical protein
MKWLEVPWHSDLKPARDAYIKAAQAAGDWGLEVRPGSTDYFPLDLIDPRTGKRVGSPPVKKADEYLGRNGLLEKYRKTTGRYPRVEAASSGGTLEIKWPPELSPPPSPPAAAPNQPSGAAQAGGRLRRLFGGK